MTKNFRASQKKQQRDLGKIGVQREWAMSAETWSMRDRQGEVEGLSDGWVV